MDQYADAFQRQAVEVMGFDDLQPLPVNARLNFLRPAYCQLSHHYHRLRRGGKHLIYNRFAFSFTTFWKAERQID